MNAGRKSIAMIFRIPLLVFAASVAGLVAALVLDGPADIAAVAAAAAPLIALAVVLLR